MAHSLHNHGTMDSDRSLLEGLYQLALSGRTGGRDFDLIDNEVYTRLLQAYQAEPGEDPARSAA